jgi:hypothetical protein
MPCSSSCALLRAQIKREQRHVEKWRRMLGAGAGGAVSAPGAGAGAAAAAAAGAAAAGAARAPAAGGGGAAGGGAAACFAAYWAAKPHKVKRRVRKGVPDEFRGLVWQLLSGARRRARQRVCVGRGMGG